MQHILVIADPVEEKQLAFHKALDFANKTGADIRVLVFCYESLKDIAESQNEADMFKQKIIDFQSEWWRTYTSQHAPGTTNIQINIVWQKDIHSWIIDHTQTTPYDLVIKTGHRSESLFYTPTDWHLFRDCYAPVYCVTKEHSRQKKVILACLDIATENYEKKQLNDYIIEAAFRLAVQTGGELHCCHIVHIPSIVRELQLLDITAKVHREEKNVMAVMAPLLDEYDIKADNIHVREGDPGQVVPSLARKIKADCVVIGCLGRKGITGKFIGNTAEKAVKYLLTDLLVINHQKPQ